MAMNILFSRLSSFAPLSLALTTAVLSGCSSTPKIANSTTNTESVNISVSSAEQNTSTTDFYQASQPAVDLPQIKQQLPSTNRFELDELEAILSSNNSSPSTKNQMSNQMSCPGMKLVLSCGNSICETNLGENQDNCPADCVPAPVVSYNNQTRCTQTQAVFHPENTAQVQEIVRMALSSGKKVKVIGNSHSANSILCTDGFTIVTDRLNRVLGLESFEGEDTVLTEGGISIWDLNEWLLKNGKSLGYPIMGFRGVTIAGAMGTSSHGSSTKHNAVISNQVQSITLVDGLGNVQELTKKTTPSDTWKAATASLGMLGIITQVRLKVQKAINLDTRVTFHSEKELFKKGGVFAPVKGCDWGVMNWFPGAKKFMKICGKETSKKAEPGANNVLLSPAVPSGIVGLAKQTLQYAACKKGVACLIDQIRFTTLKLSPPLQKENKFGKLVATRNAVGPAHRMQSAFLTPYQKGFFQMDWEIAIPQSRAAEAMAWVKRHVEQNKICLPLVGVFLRFTPALDESLLGYTNAGGDFIKNEPVVYIEMPVYLPVGFTATQKAEYDRPFEELARTLITRFGGHAHWGKNRDWVFELQRNLGVYGDRIERFKKVAHELDPHGIFENSYSKMIGL